MQAWPCLALPGLACWAFITFFQAKSTREEILPEELSFFKAQARISYEKEANSNMGQYCPKMDSNYLTKDLKCSKFIIVAQTGLKSQQNMN